MVSSTSSPTVLSRPLAVVTGAASGIGSALVAALLARDLDVVAIDLQTDGIDPRALRFEVDVRDAPAMMALAARFSHRPATHVFANAGVGGIAGDAPGRADSDAVLRGNPFADLLTQALESAETPEVFALRLPRTLDEGAPFYRLTHDDTRDWVHAPHRSIEHGGPPFSDFGMPTPPSAQEAA